MYRLVRELDPDGVSERRRRARQHRGAVILPGPNEMWSMDAYCKLEHWGIQIYAAVDAYSRFVIWYYVGISGRTAVSVLGQYVSTITTTKTAPRKIRTDRGAETPMTADAHYAISSEVRAPEDGSLLEFRDTFRFGTSKENSIIERWWRQQSYGAILQWRDCFLEYNREEEYVAHWRSDRIAFLAIYMPILRKASSDFVETWNCHRIRKQPNRPYLTPGIPYVLYNYPERTGGVQSGFTVPEDSPTLNAIQDDLMGLDLDEYLPPTTLQWCGDVLEAAGFQREIDGSATTDAGERVHRLAYFALRDAARRHIGQQLDPELPESDKPRNARRWSTEYRPSDVIQRVFYDANEELVERHPMERFEDEMEPTLDDEALTEERLRNVMLAATNNAV